MSESQLCGPVLGCIADDITGATDLAINLVKGGMRVVQVMELLSPAEIRALDCDAIVVALKIRSVPSTSAVETAGLALKGLQEAGCQRFLYKYCSTFDSTDQGNIGPIAEALLEATQQQQTVFCPAFPLAGRTVYQSHLFVGDRLLSESGMENHPLNPMRDANLVRVLGRQAKSKVGSVTAATIEQGAEAVTAKLKELAAEDVALVILDTCTASHLATLASAVANMKLITGGSGIARYLPEAFRAIGVVAAQPFSAEVPKVDGPAFVLSGSCSTATQRQVAELAEKVPHAAIDVENALRDSAGEVQRLVQWAESCGDAAIRMVHSTADAAVVENLQAKFGMQQVAEAIESTLASFAQRIVAELHVRRIIVAGGETSGAVVNGLGVRSLRIGAEICPGVPWTVTSEPCDMALAFKSGNFGSDAFFSEALDMLDRR